MTRRRLRVGIVGANWGLVGHLPVWRGMADVEVVAICTSNHTSARAAADRFGIPLAYGDHQQMLSEADLDIVDIGTKPSIRQQIALDAIEAGKHVLTCNPFAVDADAGLAQFNRQRGHVVGAIEAQFQWLPHFIHMRELIAEGYIGQFKAASIRCHFGLQAAGQATFPALTRPIGFPDSTGYSWLGDATSGASVVRNIGGHCLHPVVSLFGDVAEVVAQTDIAIEEWQFPDGTSVRPNTADTAFAILRFRDGGTAEVNVGWSVPSGRGYAMEIWGTEGKLRVAAPGGFPDTSTLSLFGARLDRSGVQQSEDKPTLWQDLEKPIAIPDRLLHPPGSDTAVADGGRYRLAMFNIFRSMIDAIRNGGRATPDFRQALHVQFICEAIERSSTTRQWEQVPGIPGEDSLA